MACLNPLRILSPESRWLRKCRKENRSYEFYLQHANDRRNPFLDPEPLCDNPFDYYNTPNHTETRYSIVPCGKCENCKKAVADGYFIRCYYEFLRTIHEYHGSCWFITLTFGDEFLPRLVDGTPCFDKDYVQRFLKRFAKYSQFDFKYFIVSELGGEFGRPHHHGILFIKNLPNVDNNQFKVLDYVARAWTKVVDKRKEFSSMNYLGLFDLQRVDAQRLQDIKQLRYVAKYVGKQFGADDFDSREDVPYNNKRFHLQSLGLGDNFEDFISRKDWMSGRLRIDGFDYTIPLYFKNKVMREFYCFHENGNIIYRPTDFKLQYISALSRRQFDEHKHLALLNSDYPCPPDWCYDAETLGLIYNFLDDYVVFREEPKNPLVTDLLNEWSNYLEDVQRYNHSKYKAQAEKQKRERKERFLKKTGRK